MSKMLFITTLPVNSNISGGHQCTKRNYDSMCEIFGFKNVSLIHLADESNSSFLNKIEKWINIFLFSFNKGLTRKKFDLIMNEYIKYDYVFFDSSLNGILAKKLKMANFTGKSITFFHNVEYNFRKQLLKTNPWSFIEFFIQCKNEKLAAKYSDINIALNTRDKKEIEKLYGIEVTTLIPISLKDSFKKDENYNKSINNLELNILFIGSNFLPNIQGISWFTEKVLPKLEANLTIVGKGLKEMIPDKQITFLDYVDDLSHIINKSDLIILPIFKGSGMKVKTCEALMYGKYIFGTSEAFCGYEIDYTKTGALCNSEEDFIISLSKFKELKKSKFNPYAREIYREKYSFEKTLVKFKYILNIY